VQSSALQSDAWVRPAGRTAFLRARIGSGVRSRALVLGTLASAAAFALLAVAASFDLGSHWQFDLSVRLNGAVDDAGFNAPLDEALVVISGIGTVLVLTAAALLVARRRFRPACLLLFSLALPLGLAPVLKVLVRQPSLLDAHGAFSFPSGNAAVATGVLAAVVLLVRPGPWRRAAAACATLVLAVFAAALVAAAWHYPSDIAGGCMLGLLCTLLLHWMLADRPVTLPDT
jgi:PAP2 superfamily